MSAREWKPGDVAMFRIDRWPAAREWSDDTSQVLMRFDGSYWDAVEGDPAAPLTVPPGCRDHMHPLVVIDPEDAEQVERLARLYIERAFPLYKHLGKGAEPRIVGDFAATLREFANPTPRIEEPAGLGAVVEDADGLLYVRHNFGAGGAAWCCDEISIHWEDVDAVRILSEGVPS